MLKRREEERREGVKREGKKGEESARIDEESGYKIVTAVPSGR